MKQLLWVFVCNLCPEQPERLEIDGRATLKAAEDLAKQAGWSSDGRSIHKCKRCHFYIRTEIRR